MQKYLWLKFAWLSGHQTVDAKHKNTIVVYAATPSSSFYHMKSPPEVAKHMTMIMVHNTS